MCNTAGRHVKDIHSALVTSGEACFQPFQPPSTSSGNKWALMLKACLFQMTDYQINTAKLLPNTAHGDTIFFRLLEHGNSNLLAPHHLGFLVKSFTFSFVICVCVAEEQKDGRMFAFSKQGVDVPPESRR